MTFSLRIDGINVTFDMNLADSPKAAWGIYVTRRNTQGNGKSRIVQYTFSNTVK